MGHFRLSPLRGDRILQAYPLIRASGADITVEDWRSFVRTFLGAAAQGGSCRDIVGICATNGYLRGLFTYMVRPDVHHGRCLDVEYFVVEGIYSPREIAEALMVGVEEEARRHDCRAIHAKIQPGPNWFSDMLKDRRYESEISAWCKPSV